MHKVVESGTVEDGVMAEVMLEPACLCLTGCNQTSWEQPCQPAVTKVPEDPPAQDVHGKNVGELDDEEKWAGAKHPLKVVERWVKNWKSPYAYTIVEVQCNYLH